ncbi:N-acetylglucosamine-1-phosphodiester alpha-N-acetylglucosaminidase-like isoform X2 [Cyclopterus lumpus]|uniref:N-acetylglucosamine-1-phosphodiester alpha-N-acetylglucosaminidase-like isoform X2 n=1 Tax=Cyclopterus lumpus TaxID=8103 RepID=UPI001486125F|nr:N-acetylglucosamine-1-phosphodiester alpha-N-acetylglucosaminidase-like isoform X2 [Cyclopterus lumpus]
MAAAAPTQPLVWLLLWLCVRPFGTSNTRVSLGDDVLSPYAGGHGPAHSHRHVRDCQPAVHGNVTHETRPASTSGGGAASVAESTVFVSDVPGSSRRVYGHVTVVRDPLRTLSVLEPGGPGGCRGNRSSTVEETAGRCLYAQNAGFFLPDTHECLGNVVSDGRPVRDSGGVQNAQFGIRRDGSLVFGYLSQDEVLDRSNPFVQLVSGVVWLLRSGEVYINQSLQAECDKTQKTGRFRTFVDVVSARTAVGHDGEGNVVLFHIDGQTGVRGMNLWEVAESLKSYGVINAINLDGGGSSTYVANGSLASYPSDLCIPDGRWRCARAVSTVLCVHPRRCEPADCGGHGDCADGRCRCRRGWRGAGCDSPDCRPEACGPHGVCTADGCDCDAGWRGKNCSQVCPLGFFGASCSEECLCDDQCPCDPQTGSCNATLRGEANYTLHGAGRCLAKQMFTLWRRDEEARREQPRLTENQDRPALVQSRTGLNFDGWPLNPKQTVTDDKEKHHFLRDATNICSLSRFRTAR